MVKIKRSTDLRRKKSNIKLLNFLCDIREFNIRFYYRCRFKTKFFKQYNCKKRSINK